MSYHEPEAYTYEADIHCPTCAEAAHGRGPNGWIAEDADEVRVLAYADEAIDPDHDYAQGPAIVGCGTCGVVLDANVSVDDYAARGGEAVGAVDAWHAARYDALADELEDTRAELEAARAELDTRADLEAARAELEDLRGHVLDHVRGLISLGELAEHVTGERYFELIG